MAYYKYFRKNASGFAWLSGSAAAGLIYMYPHTFGLKQYTNRVTSWTKNEPDVVDTEILALAEEVKNDLKWRNAPFQKQSLTFIQTKFTDFSRRGSCTTRWGGIIGVPAFFSTSSLKRAEENTDILLPYNIDLQTEEGQEIFDTFKLSRAAKKFALATEMCQVKTAQVYFDVCGLVMTGFGCYAIAQTLSQFLSFRGAVIFSYMIVIPVLALACARTSDLYNCYIEAKCDKKAASISKDVADGGIEYYSSLIMRQEAIENTKTQKKFIDDTKIPDIRQKWWKTELPVTERKDCLVEVSRKLYYENYVPLV